MAPYLEKDMLSLYTLIWKRFVACQMASAQYDQTTVLIDADGYGLKTVGSIMRFLGFMTLYVEATDDGTSGNGNQASSDKKGKDIQLPDLKEGDILQLLEVFPKQHFTQPPPRYNEATLVKALEENGVGRPSTYAAILSTIRQKEYVNLVNRYFRPTELGYIVNDLLVENFPDIFSVEFTARLEENLDRVESANFVAIHLEARAFDILEKL